MRYLLLAPDIFASEGGIARILRLYLKALCDVSRTEDQIRLVSLIDRAPDTKDFRRYSNRRLCEWHVCNRNKVDFVIQTIRMGVHSDRIICGHIGQLPVAYLASKLKPGLKYDLIAHGLEVWRKFNVLERRALLGASRIFCVSNFTKERLLEYCPIPRDRILVLYNALDPFLEPGPAKPLPESPLVLSVSRLSASEEYKGVDHLIMALPAVRKSLPDARLRIVGRGSALSQLQALVRKLNLENAVEFTGYRTDLELRGDFDDCRLFALPSEKEGFGLVYLEALSHGRPCLAALAGGAPEIVTKSCGVLVKYGDVDNIASSIVEALTRSWDPTAMQSRAKDFSFERFRTRLSQEMFS